MAELRLDLGGIFPPIPTPFSKSGAIDFDALRRNLEFLARYALRGVVALGSNGEAVHLSSDERIELVRAVKSLLPADRLLIAGTGCPSTRETVELSRRAADAGADGVLVLPPHYYKSQMTRDCLVRHYHTVAETSSVPVVLYNMPAATGSDLDADAIIAVAAHPNILGLKDSGGDIAKLALLRDRLGKSFQVLAGSASYLLPALSIGAVGGVHALANIAPAQCLGIQENAAAGHWDQAMSIQVRMVEPNTAVTRRWGVAGLKAAMNLLGLDGGHVRAPLLDLSAPDIAELKEILVSAGILSADRKGAHQP